MFRLLIETLFVIGIPGYLVLTIDVFWVRILIAGLVATPVYSYLKMASFKFFLEIYRGFGLVRQEYTAYYAALP